MGISQSRKIIELKNIGKKIAGRLHKAGIFSEDEIRFYDAVKAHTMRIKWISKSGTCFAFAKTCYF
ncbi:MAG: hypothetical protein GXP08_09585 [Gammaproteobacteria bacterium]|nr:hypothetical protein [Gammaproteobacteria bacterium]